MSLWKIGCGPKDAEAIVRNRIESTIDPCDIKNSLRMCCAEQVMAGIIHTNSNRICQGVFSRISDNSVILNVDAPEDFHFFPLTTCMVTYFLDGKAHVFISFLKDVYKNDAGPSRRLFLRMREQMAISQVRWAFRVPTQGIPNLEVTLHCPSGENFNPVIRDLSFGGMRVEFRESEDPNLCLGGHGHLTLRHDDLEITLEAEVRRRKGHSYGLFFPGVFKDNEFDPPEVYRSIVNRLEKRWLQLRKDC